MLPTPALRVSWVDGDQGWTSSPIDTMGEWGPASLTFDGVRVSPSAVLGEVGQGFALAMRWIGQGRYLLPARALGGCERMVEMAMDHARGRPDQGGDSRHAQSIVKLFDGIKANEIVDRMLQVHGGMGHTRELPLERWYRELRLLRIYEGTDEIKRRTIARNLLKGHATVRGPL